MEGLVFRSTNAYVSSLLLFMKSRKLMQSRQTGVKTIKRRRQEKNAEIKQNDAARGMASPSPDSDQEGFQQLELLLRSADIAFTDPDHPRWPEQLRVDLFESVVALQYAIGRTNVCRTPFWKCVRALDHARPKLRLQLRLAHLVKRACKTPPSPLATLRTSQQLNAHELALVDDIAKAFFDYADAAAALLFLTSLINATYFEDVHNSTVAPSSQSSLFLIVL